MVGPTIQGNEVKRGSTLYATTSKTFESTGYAYSSAVNSNNLVHFEVTDGDLSNNFVSDTAD